MTSRIAIAIALAIAPWSVGCSERCFIDGVGCDEDPGTFVAIAASADRTCALRDLVAWGQLRCWGAMHDLPRAASYSAIALGDAHTCVIDASGVRCAGDPIATARAPTTGRWRSLAAGSRHSCVVPDALTGRVVCWGDNSFGQAPLDTGVEASLVVTGSEHSCAVDLVGSVACWGRNDAGQATPTPGEYNAITAGETHSCGIRWDGTIACWGQQPDGVPPPDGTFAAISAGATHTCAIRDDDTLACWGNDDQGQSSPPTGTFRAIASGARHTCGIRTDGDLACWGADDHGQASPP